MLLVYFFRVRIFGFKVCHSPDLIGISKIEVQKNELDNIILIEGDIVSSALFYNDYTYKIEDGILKLGVSYTNFKQLSTGSSKFSITINTEESINEVYLMNHKSKKIIFKSVE